MKGKKLKNKKKEMKIFLDSGAYSAWNKSNNSNVSVEIDIDEYIAFIKEYESFLEAYANLDVIGDAEGTMRNQKIMEKAGLSPIPVFHYGEDVKYLEYYVANNSYVSLGGMVPLSKKSDILTQWLDDLFSSVLCKKKDGMPKVKVHGFGLTSLPLMCRYPWYSIDSTSWVQASRNGNIYVPKYKYGKWIYDEKSIIAPVSARSPEFHTLSHHVKKLVSDYLDSKGYKLGKSEFKDTPLDYKLKANEKFIGKKDEAIKKGFREVEIVIEKGVSNIYTQRDEINIIYFADLQKHFPKWPWAFQLKVRKGFDI